MDLLFDHDVVAVDQQVPQRLLKLLLRVGQLHADGGAAVDDLHRAGDLQLLNKAGNVGFGIVDVVPRGGAHAAALHDLLRQGLIHRHAAAEIARAGIRHAEQVERRLDAAILAAGAVQREKYDVGHAAHGQNVLAEHGRALVFAASAHGLEVGRLTLHAVIRAQAVRRVEDVLQTPLVVLQTEEHVHQNGLVPALAQRAAHARAGGERHKALRGKSARQNNNFHNSCDSSL